MFPVAYACVKMQPGTLSFRRLVLRFWGQNTGIMTSIYSSTRLPSEDQRRKGQQFHSVVRGNFKCTCYAAVVQPSRLSARWDRTVVMVGMVGVVFVVPVVPVEQIAPMRRVGEKMLLELSQSQRRCTRGTLPDSTGVRGRVVPGLFSSFSWPGRGGVAVMAVEHVYESRFVDNVVAAGYSGRTSGRGLPPRIHRREAPLLLLQGGVGVLSEEALEPGQHRRGRLASVAWRWRGQTVSVCPAS